MRRGTSAINALLAVDKPCGMTSHDVVSRVRRALGERRVGHAGTLDPDASGVMVVGVGQATKLLGMLTLDRKCYRARIEFGSQTATDDAEGEVIATSAVPPELFDAAFAARAVAGLVGEHEQMPPAYSAISVGGKRAYALAREGKEVKLSSRHVIIHEASLLSVTGDGTAESPLVWECDFDVSKGTYIRSIARDLGLALGTHAHLCGLRRTSAGMVGIADCVSLDELSERGRDLMADHALDPVACLGIATREVEVAEISDITCGRHIPMGLVSLDGVAREPRPGEPVALVWDHALVGVWQRRSIDLVCSTNFPQAIEGVR